MADIPLEQVRAHLVKRLQARWSELEQAVIARVYSISDPSYTQDAAYIEGLRAAVSVALDFGLAAIRRNDEELPLPRVLLEQARLAAENQVGLAAVTRRYVAGYRILGEFVMEEAERSFPNVAIIHLVYRSQARAFDRMLAAVSAEYTKAAGIGEAAGAGVDSLEERRAECVKSLLAGERTDSSLLAYRFDAWHTGLLVSGEQAQDTVRALGATLDRRVLAVPGEGTVTWWGWLGGATPLAPERIADILYDRVSGSHTAAFGEPAHGLAGWRVTHRQAAAALPVAWRGRLQVARYGEVALLASALKDELLASSLRQIYLVPLAAGRDDGRVLLQTLRAYFAAERNVSSAAMALGVKRHTVTNRLRVIEERLGRPLSGCATDVEMALRLQELERADESVEAKADIE